MVLNYSYKEYLLRILWWLIQPLFKYSPRLLYSWRNFLLTCFGAKISRSARIYPSCQITFPWNLEIGSGTTVAWNVRIYNLGLVAVGENVVISQYSHLCAGTHDYSTSDFKLLKPKIIVKDNVWIAADVFVGPGVSIENGCVIAARSVVVKNTEANSLYAGNPAKKIKQL